MEAACDSVPVFENEKLSEFAKQQFGILGAKIFNFEKSSLLVSCRQNNIISARPLIIFFSVRVGPGKKI